MGVGKNVHKRLAAIHDLNLPWRVRDMIQRGGRIERFGNMFKNAKRFIYTTKDSFDLFIWQKLKQKADIAHQAKTNPRNAIREFDEDVEPTYADIMAIATGNPIIQEAIELEAEIERLEMLERSFHRNRANLRSEKENTIFHLANNKAELQQLKGINKTISGQPVCIGDLNVVDEKSAKKISKALTKSVKAALKDSPNQRTFKIGTMGEADIVLQALFNGNFVIRLKQGDVFDREVAKARHIINVINSPEFVCGQINEDIELVKYSIEKGEKTLAAYERNDGAAESFPDSQKLIDTKIRYSEAEKEIALLLVNQDENEDPFEHWENLIEELNNPDLGVESTLDINLEALNNELKKDTVTANIVLQGELMP